MTSSARTQPPKRIGTNGQKIPLHTLATTTIPGIPRAIAARTAKTNRRERFPLTHSRAPTGYLDDSRLPPPHEDLRNGLREGDHIFFLEAIRGVDSRERRQVLEHVHEDAILERRGDRRPPRVFGADHPPSFRFRRFRTLRSSSWRSRAFGEFGSFWASAFAPPSRRATYAASLS